MRPLTVGSQYKFLDTITKNGAVWDLTGATVTIFFKRPDGSTFSTAGSLHDADSGQVTYTCSTSDLSVAGNWTRSWRVVLGGFTDYSEPILFTVVASP